MNIIERARDQFATAWTRPSAFGVLAVNLVPIIGILFWGWNASALMFLYWLENVIIGGFNVLRMGSSGVAHGRVGAVSALFLIPFFIFHYGLFCFVHGVFVMVFFGGGMGEMANRVSATLGEPFDLLSVARAMLTAQPSIQTGILAILVWQTLQFLIFYMGQGVYKRVDPMSQMFAPYARIIILHITIMAAGIVVVTLGAPMIGVLALALLKTAFDIGGEGAKMDAQAKDSWEKLQALAANGFKEPPAPPSQ